MRAGKYPWLRSNSMRSLFEVKKAISNPAKNAEANKHKKMTKNGLTFYKYKAQGFTSGSFSFTVPRGFKMR